MTQHKAYEDDRQYTITDKNGKHGVELPDGRTILDPIYDEVEIWYNSESSK